MKYIPQLLAPLLALVSPAFAEVGEVADFSALDKVEFYRSPISAQDLQGKVVLLEYWGIMCHPCRRAMPEFQQLYQEYKDRGLVVVASHCQNTTSQDMAKFLDARDITFPVCSRFYLPQAPMPKLLPLTVLIGADGKVIAFGKPWQIIPLAKEELQRTAPAAPQR